MPTTRCRLGHSSFGHARLPDWLPRVGGSAGQGYGAAPLPLLADLRGQDLLPGLSAEFDAVDLNTQARDGGRGCATIRASAAILLGFEPFGGP